MRNESIVECRVRSAECKSIHPKSKISLLSNALIGGNPNSRGVTIIAAIFIIVVLGFMGVMFLTMVNTGSFTAVNDIQSAEALYVAEGGLERTIRFLNSPILDPLGVDPDRRRACANVTGDAALTNVALGQGLFRVVTETGSPFYSANAVTLNGMIDNLVTDIPVNGDPIASGYAQYGRIMIDREIIDYSGTTANSFTGAVRGRDGTATAAHANLTRVGHYQCTTTSTGGIPDLAAPRAQRAVREGVQLQEGWAVGNNGVILRWNGTAWAAAASPVGSDINSISMLSYADGWAVGNNSAGEVILLWNGAVWSRVGPSGAISNRNIRSIYCVSTNDCWAVGVDGGVGERPWILQWTGAWSTYDTTLLGIRTPLNSIYCVATNDCWAVGDAWGAAEVILHWDGAAWSRVGPGAISNRNIRSIYCVSTNDCWAVGVDGGVGERPWILQWTGAWSTYDTTLLGIRTPLNSIYCVATNDCWAVGDAWGGAEVILHWDGAAWSRVGPSAAIPNTNLNSVYCVDFSDCWAVGDGGLILHWDGATWTQIASPTGQNLQGVYLIGPRQRPQAMWQEVIQ